MNKLALGSLAILAAAAIAPASAADLPTKAPAMAPAYAAPANWTGLYINGGFGYGMWVADTIPEVIAPGTWNGAGVLRYNAPSRVLVVYHSRRVQAEVDDFLTKMKRQANNSSISSSHLSRYRHGTSQNVS